MRIRTFHASNMNEAMESIRAALGDDAIILTSKNAGQGKGVIVTVAIDEEAEDERIVPATPDLDWPSDPEPEHHPHVTNGMDAWRKISRQEPEEEAPAPAPVTKSNGQAPTNSNRVDVSAARQQQLREMEAVLRYHSTPTHIMEKLLETARFLPLPPGLNFGGVKRAMGQVLDVFFQFAPLHLEEDHRVMLIGPPGVGKTMTVAKLAARLKVEKKRVHVITTDNSRAGGIEQLQSLMTILDIPLHVAEDKSALKAILSKLPASDCTLIDTAGVNPYDADELKELAGLISIGNIEPVLVLPAGMDAQESEFAARSFRLIADIKRLLATRTDVARRFGSLMAASHALGAAFCNASGSAKVLGDFITLNAEVFSALLMQHRLDQNDRGGSHQL